MLEITSISQFNKLKTNHLLIIDFHATWCGPCKVISPVFEKLGKQYESSTSIIFAKCDVDKAQEVAQSCNITAMPTFQFFKAGQKVDEVRGANSQQLTTKIGYYTAAVIKEGTGRGTKAESSKSVSSITGSLRSVIDINTSKLLNASLLSSVRNIASPPPAGYAVASASGPQLLIHLAFSQPINPTHLNISTAKDSKSNAPSRVQVATNVPVRVMTNKEGVESNDLSMESLVRAENTQAFNIFSDEYSNGKIELKLKASKFYGAKSLTIRVDANLSGEASTISKIGEMDVIGIKA